jgi:hypothetical protein
MTPKQRIYLFRLFAAAARKSGARADDELRAEWTFQILGLPVSWACLTRGQIDQLIIALKKIADGIPLTDQIANDLEAENAERTRLVYAIAAYLPRGTDAPHGTGVFWPEYVAKISENCFGSSNWRGLPVPQLRKLRMTLDHRARSKK